MNKKTVLLLLFSLAILVVILWFVGIGEIIAALKFADLRLILVAVLVQFFVFYLYTLRWRIIANMADMNLSIKKLLPITLVGLAANNITPMGRGGGEPVRAYILSRDIGVTMEESFATVVADKALDTFPFVFLALLTIIGATFTFNMDLWLVILMAVAMILIIAFLIILIYLSINEKFGEKLSNWCIGIVRRFYKKNSSELEEKIVSVVNGFQDTMSNLISNRNILYYALPLSFIIWGFEILRVYLVFLAFGADISPVIIGEVFILASLIGMIPLLPGGLGAVDGVMILFYASAGISASVSAAATVIERLISYWLATILGMLLLPYYGSSVLDKLSLNSSSDKELDAEMKKIDQEIKNSSNDEIK